MDGFQNKVQSKILSREKRKMAKRISKVLGVWFATDQDTVVSLNYNEKLMEIRSILGCRKF